MIHDGIDIELLKREDNKEYYLVGIENTKKAPEILISYLREEMIRFSSMKPESLVEEDAYIQLVEDRVPFAGTIIKVNNPKKL